MITALRMFRSKEILFFITSSAMLFVCLAIPAAAQQTPAFYCAYQVNKQDYVAGFETPGSDPDAIQQTVIKEFNAYLNKQYGLGIDEANEYKRGSCDPYPSMAKVQQQFSWTYDLASRVGVTVVKTAFEFHETLEPMVARSSSGEGKSQASALLHAMESAQRSFGDSVRKWADNKCTTTMRKPSQYSVESAPTKVWVCSVNFMTSKSKTAQTARAATGIDDSDIDATNKAKAAATNAYGDKVSDWGSPVCSQEMMLGTKYEVAGKPRLRSICVITYMMRQ